MIDEAYYLLRHIDAWEKKLLHAEGQQRWRCFIPENNPQLSRRQIRRGYEKFRKATFIVEQCQRKLAEARYAYEIFVIRIGFKHNLA